MINNNYENRDYYYFYEVKYALNKIFEENLKVVNEMKKCFQLEDKIKDINLIIEYNPRYYQSNNYEPSYNEGIDIFVITKRKAKYILSLLEDLKYIRYYNYHMFTDIFKLFFPNQSTDGAVIINEYDGIKISPLTYKKRMSNIIIKDTAYLNELRNNLLNLEIYSDISDPNTTIDIFSFNENYLHIHSSKSKTVEYYKPNIITIGGYSLKDELRTLEDEEELENIKDNKLYTFKENFEKIPKELINKDIQKIINEILNNMNNSHYQENEPVKLRKKEK